VRRGPRRGGPQGPPDGREKKGRPGRRRRPKGAPGRDTLAKEKPPVFGVIQRGGQIAIRVLADVKQKTIGALIRQAIAPGAAVFTDEYGIYSRLPQWGYAHQAVGHAPGEFARDDDGDGFREVHVNTREGFWSLLRSWLRPHRGISQEKLPLYLGFFEFVHNIRRRGNALLGALVGLLLKPSPRNTG
jgi:transposase-like protein